jgi:MazG family protein
VRRADDFDVVLHFGHSDGSVTQGLSEALLELQQLTETLRRECPWDREQTARTIVPHTVEEAYEVAEAALEGDDAKLLDELGDLLFQTYFLALLLDERGAGDLAQVARNVHEKLVRRHPHVFGDVDAPTAGRVRENWERIKVEQEERQGIFHDVAQNLPALLYARKMQRRARAVGFEYPDLPGALADLDDELRELKESIDAAGGEPAPEVEPDAHVFGELGDVLFATVNVARRLNVDPELALRTVSDRFRTRVERAEQLAARDGRTWTDLALDEQDRYFDEAKEELRLG